MLNYKWELLLVRDSPEKCIPNEIQATDIMMKFPSHMPLITRPVLYLQELTIAFANNFKNKNRAFKITFFNKFPDRIISTLMQNYVA